MVRRGLLLRLMLWLAAWSLGMAHVCPGCPSAGKRDIFMSRGWGAGGMPFTLFYPGPGPMQDSREQPQVEYLTSGRHPQQHQEPDTSKPATLPQLFVSYGWGPLGRK